MRRSNLPATLVLLALLLFPIQSLSAEVIDSTVQVTAENFLAMLDDGEYELAWSQTSLVNQSYLGTPEWFSKAQAARPYIGYLIDRSLKTISQHTAWTALPDGDYVRISYVTQFLNKASCLETIVLIREGGVWSVSGYFLR